MKPLCSTNNQNCQIYRNQNEDAANVIEAELEIVEEAANQVVDNIIEKKEDTHEEKKDPENKEEEKPRDKIFVRPRFVKVKINFHWKEFVIKVPLGGTEHHKEVVSRCIGRE